MITFKDESGKSYNIHGSKTKPLSRLKTEDQVEVIYLANNPNKGVVNTWSEFWEDAEAHALAIAKNPQDIRC